MSGNQGILLKGLDGSNPLAFLAGLGTLRVLTLAMPAKPVCMSWEAHMGRWVARLHCPLTATLKLSESDIQHHLIEVLNNYFAAATHESLQIGDNTNLPWEAFGDHLRATLSKALHPDSGLMREELDFLAAFGSEAIRDEKGIMADTALRTMSGAGHQHFLKTMRDLIGKTQAEHLRRALMETWDYADEGRGLNLRWDPQDDRRYALRWQNPSNDPNKTMRGANRLAIEALPLFPTLPQEGRLSTTCFEGKGARNTRFYWPIWSPALNLDSVRSLLAQTMGIRAANMPARQAMGISQIFTSTRITVGKFRNFTPAESA